MNSIAHFQSDKYGLFVTYTWPGFKRADSHAYPMYPDGRRVCSVDEMIRKFDAEQFASDCVEFGVQYVIFTVWHYGMNPLYPSDVFKKWRSCQEDNPETEDLIEKIYSELHTRGIKLYLYTHPYDLHDLYDEDKRIFDYKYRGDLTFDYTKWNDYLNDQYAELCERYRGKIWGFFIDEGLSGPTPNDLSVDYPRLRDTIKSIDPSLVMIQNWYGSNYACDVGMLEDRPQLFGGNIHNMNTWAISDMPYGARIGRHPFVWSAAFNKDEGDQIDLASPEDVYRFTALEAAANTGGGGCCWACGPYAGRCDDRDGADMWEPGVRDFFVRLYGYIRPVEEAIKNTVPSRSFPTTLRTVEAPAESGLQPGPYSGTFLPELAWGGATESPGGDKTYLHVVIPPPGNTINLGVPANGKVFTTATLLATGQPLLLTQNADGVSVTLPEGIDWNPLNTVITLTAR